MTISIGKKITFSVYMLQEKEVTTAWKFHQLSFCVNQFFWAITLRAVDLDSVGESGRNKFSIIELAQISPHKMHIYFRVFARERSARIWNLYIEQESLRNSVYYHWILCLCYNNLFYNNEVLCKSIPIIGRRRKQNKKCYIAKLSFKIQFLATRK